MGEAPFVAAAVDSESLPQFAASLYAQPRPPSRVRRSAVGARRLADRSYIYAKYASAAIRDADTIRGMHI